MLYSRSNAHKSNAKCELSVIAPVYRGETFIQELMERLVGSLSTITQNFEIVLVDDGSPDAAWQLIVEAGSRDSRIKGLRLSRNFGQHPAITAGIDFASGRYLVVMDSDLQDRPEDIPGLYRAIEESKFDVVIARRAVQDIALTKRIPSLIFNWVLAWLGGIETHQQIGNFRIFTDSVATAFRSHREQFRLFPALMARLGFRVGFYDVARDARPRGRSTYTFGKLVALAVDAIVANSEKPLWFGIYGGAILSIVAIGLAVWAVARKLVYDVGMGGWSSLFVAIAFFSGVQLMFAGLIGVYIGRIFHETKQRPIYILAETINGGAVEATATHTVSEDRPTESVSGCGRSL